MEKVGLLFSLNFNQSC